MVAQNVPAILKDIKVTKNGINISLEDVKLKGEQLQNLASLIGGSVLIAVDTPQMNLFEDENVNELKESEPVEGQISMTDEEVAQELGI